MKTLIFVSIVLIVSINVGFSQGKGANELCTVGTEECASPLKCIPSSYDQVNYGKYSKEGICLQPVADGQTCTPKSMRTICQSGSTCVHITGQQVTDGTGVCKKLSELSSEQVVLAIGDTPKPLASNPVSGCKYLPGNYFFDSATPEQCCGITRTIPDPVNASRTVSGPLYCDYVKPGESKAVIHPNYCAKTIYGTSAVWESQNIPLSAGPANTPGKCLNPPNYDPTVVLGEDPAYEWNEVQCTATFSNTDLESRVGLRSDWEGVGVNRYWFTSLPSANFYRPGDELFMMAYIWLFKNTDVESTGNANTLAKALAQKLYDSFERYYSKSYRDSYQLMNALDQLKQCMNLQSPVAFQLRYQMNTYIQDGLIGTLRAYQCGGADNLDPSFNCINPQLAFFRPDFDGLVIASASEESRCMDPIQSCQKTFSVSKWDDNKRKDFIIDTVKKSANVDLGDFFGGPYHDMGINGLIDPPVNRTWVPAKFLTDSSALFTELNSKNKSAQITMSTSDGREPNFYGQIILDDSKMEEAFPSIESYGGNAFLHYNKKMPYFSDEEMQYYIENHLMPGVDQTKKWNGIAGISAEAVRIMEQYSAADNNGDPVVAAVASVLLGGPAIGAIIASMQKNRQLHRVYHSEVVNYRLARLMQYYAKKLEAVEREKTCLLDKIKLLAKASGTNVDDPNFDPVQVHLDNANPSCGSGLGKFGGNGGDSFSPPVNGSTELNPLLGKNNPAKNNPNNNGQINSNGEFTGISIDAGNFQNLNGGKNTPQSISLSRLRGSNSLNAATRGSAAAAIKNTAKKQKELDWLMHKKYLDENAANPVIVAQQKIGELASSVFKRAPATPGSTMGSMHHLAGGANEENASGNTAAPSEVAGNVKEKKLGVLPPDKIKISANGTIETKSPSANAASYTGLAPADEQHILQNIRAEDVAEDEGDSLWRKLSKAYVKSYTKLFAPKNKN